VRVFCAIKFFFLIFDTFKKKTDQLYGPPYILSSSIEGLSSNLQNLTRL
jgi:hypothetical protein